jgi:hypothetical protein
MFCSGSLIAGIGIFHSVYGGVAPHHRKPHASRISARSSFPGLTTVPLQPPENIGTFWIMLLLSSSADARGMSERAASIIRP